ISDLDVPLSSVLEVIRDRLREVSRAKEEAPDSLLAKRENEPLQERLSRDGGHRFRPIGDDAAKPAAKAAGQNEHVQLRDGGHQCSACPDVSLSASDRAGETSAALLFQRM